MADGDNLYLYRDGKRAIVVEGTETDKNFREQGWAPGDPEPQAEEPVAEEPVTTEPVAEEPAEEPEAAEPVIDEEKVEDAATPIGRGRRRGR